MQINVIPQIYFNEFEALVAVKTHYLILSYETMQSGRWISEKHSSSASILKTERYLIVSIMTNALFTLNS